MHDTSPILIPNSFLTIYFHYNAIQTTLPKLSGTLSQNSSLLCISQAAGAGLQIVGAVPLSNFSKPNRQLRACISNSSGWSTRRKAQLVQTNFKSLFKSLICQPPIGQCKSHDQAQHALPKGDGQGAPHGDGSFKRVMTKGTILENKGCCLYKQLKLLICLILKSNFLSFSKFQYCSFIKFLDGSDGSRKFFLNSFNNVFLNQL